MKIAIIGSGAAGSVFAGYLRKGGADDITLVDLYKAHMEAPDVIMKKFKRAVTDSDTAANCVRWDPDNKPGVANLMQIYSSATGKAIPEIEREFEGKMYGHLKVAAGEAVVERLRPIREETARLLGDRAYLESIYKMGAEKAASVANVTLADVCKKLGFVGKPL